MTLISDPMDQMLLSPADTTVVEQATAGNDTFPAPYGSQADEEALFSDLSGPGGQPRRKRQVKGMKGVAQVLRRPQAITGGFLPGMGDDEELGAWANIFRRRTASMPPKTLSQLFKPAPKPWWQRDPAWAQLTEQQRQERQAARAKALAARTDWRTALQKKRAELQAMRHGGWWGWSRPAAPVTSPVAALVSAAPATDPTVTTPTSASSTQEAVAPVAATLPAPHLSIAPGSAPGSQFYGLDGLDGMNARRMRSPRTRDIKRSGGARVIALASKLRGGFLPGLGEELADGDDLAGLGAAPARLKPKVRVGATSAAKRMVRRPVTGGFLPGMGDDLGFLPTVPSGMMLALGIAAAYLLLRK